MNLFLIQLCWKIHWFRTLHFTIATRIICIWNCIFKGQKEREVCLNTHQFPHQSSFPSWRWRSNCKCDHVPHIASSHALAAVWYFYIEEKSMRNSTKPYSQHIILLAWHKAWEAGYIDRVMRFVLTPSQSSHSEGAANEKLQLHFHPENSAAPVSSGLSSWCAPGTEAASLH